MSQPSTAVRLGLVAGGPAWIEWVMRLIPVIDLAHGVAVQAKEGNRAHYAPVRSAMTPGITGDAFALVQAYRDNLAARECYLADLDAIQGGEIQRAAIHQLARAAGPCGLLVDAGTGDPDGVLDVLALGADRVVIGLETLRSFDNLASIVVAAGPARVVFSLDLRRGQPMLYPDGRELDGATPAAETLAGRAVAAGVTTLLVLDVGRVGTGGGVDLELVGTLRRSFPSVRLLAGGGVGGPGRPPPDPRGRMRRRAGGYRDPHRAARCSGRAGPGVAGLRSVEGQHLPVARRLAVVLLHLDLQ